MEQRRDRFGRACGTTHQCDWRLPVAVSTAERRLGPTADRFARPTIQDLLAAPVQAPYGRGRLLGCHNGGSRVRPPDCCLDVAMCAGEEKATLPDVRGQPIGQAVTALTDLGAVQPTLKLFDVAGGASGSTSHGLQNDRNLGASPVIEVHPLVPEIEAIEPYEKEADGKQSSLPTLTENDDYGKNGKEVALLFSDELQVVTSLSL